MKSYKLEFITSMSINFAVLCFIIMAFICIYKMLSLPKEDYIGFGIAVILVLAFLFYLLKTKIALARDKFCSLTVDKEEMRFIFTTKKSECYYVNFNDVEGVYMTSGEVLRGIHLGYVNVKTYEGNSYSLAITKISDFCVDLPPELNKNLEEYIFFRTNK